MRITDNCYVEIVQLAGEALPADLLLPVLNAVLPSDWLERAKQLHFQRGLPWRVDKRRRRSGAMDYLLRVVKSEEWGDTPIEAFLHISMKGKLNAGLSLHFADLPFLLAEVLKDFPPPPKENIRLRVCEPNPKGFNPPEVFPSLPEIS